MTNATTVPTSPDGTSPSTRDAVLARLDGEGIGLPVAAPGAYSYTSVVAWGDLAFVSGQIPKRDGGVAFEGQVGAERSVEDGIEAARLCVLGAIAHLDASIGLDRVARILKLNVYVASAPGFRDQPAVAEGASRLLLTAFGDAGAHARTALGVVELPKNATVEVELTVGLCA